LSARPISYFLSLFQELRFWGSQEFAALMDAVVEVASLSFLEAPPIVHVMAYMTYAWDLAGLSCMYDFSEIKHVCI